MAKLEYTFSDLTTRVSEFLGLGSTPPTKAKDIVYRGLRNFYYPINQEKGRKHNWSFLKQHHSFNTISSSWKYALPEDFSEYLTSPTFDVNTGYLPLKERSPEQILDLRTSSDSNGYPDFFAIVPVTFHNVTGTYYEMWLYPNPDGAYLLQFFYKIDPLKPEEDNDYLPGGIKAVEAIIENCLAVAEQQEDETVGLHTQLAMDLTQKLIIQDAAPTTDVIGNLYGGVREWPVARKDYTYLDIDNIYADD